MINPVDPDDDRHSYVKIGKAVMSVADKHNHEPDTLQKAREEIVKNLKRNPKPGAPQVQNIEFIEEFSFLDKIIVVPDLQMIKAGANATYKVKEVYRDHVVKQILADFVDRGVPEADWVEKLKAMAKDAIDDNEFHTYRLGEYCINQCM